MNKIEQATAALKADPSWSTSKLAKHLGIGEWTVRKARNVIGGHIPANTPRIWTATQDNRLLELRENGASFDEIAIDMDILRVSVRNRYRKLYGKEASVTVKIKVKADFIWKPGPLVQYVPVFGR